ncbi:MAG: hypothetical protein AAF434_18045 [Pseudomonadota bacterium]
MLKLLAMASLLAVASVCKATSTSLLDELVSQKSAVLDLIQRKSTKRLLAFAQDEAFADYFNAADDKSRTAAKARIDRLSLNLQLTLKLDSVGTLNNAGGVISRANNGQVDDHTTLSVATPTFFDEAFERKPNSVSVSIGHDFSENRCMVMTYATPIKIGNVKRGVVYLSQKLVNYQLPFFNKFRSEDGVYVVAVNEAGTVFADSRLSAMNVCRRSDLDSTQRTAVLSEQGLCTQTLLESPLQERIIDDGHDNRYEIAQQKSAFWTVIGVKKNPVKKNKKL